TKRLDEPPSSLRTGRRSFAVHSPTTLPPTRTRYCAAPVLTSKYCTAMSCDPAGPPYLKVAVQARRLRLQAARIRADAAALVGHARRAQEPARHRVAPDDRLPRLILQLLEDGVVTLGIHQPLQGAPLLAVLRDGVGPLVVRIVDVLD